MATRRDQDPVELPLGIKGEKVRRDISMLAFEPMNMKLTVTARKAYSVMLYLAQRTSKNDEGGYTAPLAAIVRGGGAHIKMGDVVMDYLKQMTSTNVLYRPISETEQYSLLPDQPAPDGTEEQRVFSLLAEARIFKRGGDNWVTWFYPPTIEQQIIDPQRWAVIELDVVAQLSTYTAVALYEIVARYRDSPGHLTPKRKAEFWIPILRGGSNSKDREWRKFKSEFVLPAIAQINQYSDLDIDIIEHKYGGRKVIDVQFSVRRRKRDQPIQSDPVDITLQSTGLDLGISQDQIESLLERYGHERLKTALAALQRRMSNKSMPPVGKPHKYLAESLANLGLNQDLGSAPQSSSAGPLPTRSPRTSPRSAHPSETIQRATDSLLSARIDQVSTAFSMLPQAEMDRWMDELAASLEPGPVSSRMIRRLRSREWKSPLVHGALMKFYARNGLGDPWSDPTPEQVAAFITETKSGA